MFFNLPSSACMFPPTQKQLSALPALPASGTALSNQGMEVIMGLVVPLAAAVGLNEFGMEGNQRRLWAQVEWMCYMGMAS